MLKKIKTKTIIIGSVILMALVLLIGTTFAYFTARVVGNDTAKSTQVYAGIMSLELDGTTQVTCNGLYPGGSCVYNFTVENTGTLTTSYELDFVDVLNDFNTKSELVYSLTRDSQVVVTEKEAPSINEMILPAVVITPEATQQYTLTLTFKETGTDQSNNQDKHFGARVNIRGIDSSNYLQAKVLARHINTITPDFSSADPVKLSDEKKESNKAVSITSNITGDKVIGTGYTFNPRNGIYTLTGTTTNQTYDSNSIDKYTCDNDKDKCGIMYKIKEVEQMDESSNNVTKADYYTKQETDRIYSQSGLYSTTDDQGTSYYFRGKVDNNYVSFANQLWRIMRINGDGSIRLILDGNTGSIIKFNSVQDNPKYVGYTYDNESACTKASPCISDYNATNQTFTNNKSITNSAIKEYIENTWYKSTLAAYNDKIAIGNYCNDTSVYSVSGSITYYGAYGRVREQGNASLICPDTEQNYGGFYQSKVGIASADEVAMAGLVYSQGNSSGKLATYRTFAEETNYIYHSSWWVASPYQSTRATAMEFLVSNNYRLSLYPVTQARSVRPVINLATDTIISSGDGSHDHPYVVE